MLGIGLALDLVHRTPGLPPPSEAALPTYFGSGAGDAVNNGGVLAAPFPASTLALDYSIIETVTKVGVAPTAGPAGYTALGFWDGVNVPSGSDRRLTLYGKVLAGGDATPSVTYPASNGSFGVRNHVFRGVYPVAPIDAINGATEQGVGLIYPALTTTGPNRLIVGFTTIDNCSAYTNANLANIVERTDAVHATLIGMCMWTGERAAAGNIGATTANGPNTDGIGIGILALRPA